MTDPLGWIRATASTPSEAVRWACVLEATAPKAGNVYPGRDFADLRYVDFIAAADVAAEWLGCRQLRFAERVLGAVQTTRQKLGTNVHLGILLLLGPLMAAEEKLEAPPAEPDSQRSPQTLDRMRWRQQIAKVLAGLEPDDSRRIFQAIATAAPGGLGAVESMDVAAAESEHDDLVAAMRLARDRDRIARQYADGFADLFETVVPALEFEIMRRGDLLSGIATAHLRLLAAEPDSLIARKNGAGVAREIQKRAQRFAADDIAEAVRFDRALRTDGHRLNPGTTADLIAAALYVLIRSQPEEPPA